MEQEIEYSRCSGHLVSRFPKPDTGPTEVELETTPARYHQPSSTTAVSGTINVQNKLSNIQDVHKVSPFRGASRYQVLQCFEECPCRCHQRSVVRSPRNLSTFLGDIFLGCSSLPWCFSSLVLCNEQTCKRSKKSSAELRYFFPSWLMSTTVNFNMSFRLQVIPLNVSLQTRNTIAYDSPIFIAVQEGNVDAIRTLLCSGKASLNDIDPYGLGLLYVSSIRNRSSCLHSKKNLQIIVCCLLLLERLWARYCNHSLQDFDRDGSSY